MNSRGHLLGRTAGGDTALRADPERPVAVPGSTSFVSVTDEGDVYGTLGGNPGTPLLLGCTG
ncbi:hypothetical protein SAMN05216188_103320 [Lentzea xinjiangensis]|uniref:Uncharacterized protein n=1 Tax=Lentzea xinjiangensis TaxID=402600 RepID=A0A1H9GQF0_9PSEU|nr:hypothetical protein SAMN05216188_103320 [Lentzea xinjiangensis]